jgi:hypothetical protein
MKNSNQKPQRKKAASKSGNVGSKPKPGNTGNTGNTASSGNVGRSGCVGKK